MRSEPALGGISLDFAGIPPRWDENFPYEHAQGGISLDFAGIPSRRDENFPYEHAQVGQPGKVG